MQRALLREMCLINALIINSPYKLQSLKPSKAHGHNSDNLTEKGENGFSPSEGNLRAFKLCTQTFFKNEVRLWWTTSYCFPRIKNSRHQSHRKLSHVGVLHSSPNPGSELEPVSPFLQTSSESPFFSLDGFKKSSPLENMPKRTIKEGT